MDAMMGKAQLDLIVVVVADMASSLAFYRELGMDIPPEADREPHVEVTLPSGLRLAWDTVETIRSIDPDWKPPTGGNRIGLAFRCETPADVDTAYNKLTLLGYQGSQAPWDAFWGQRYAVMRDPDGNNIDLFSPNSHP